ncbi:hypothetical protein PIB30_019969 [Stylosanthes scabra]|uniref:Uncharacterized protein n=1 Tax=Stylosanthes scabra TaxID=79078 RepID=A0ABU6Y8P2_9FABA|nr:hypothetical protein [Stylosanthes scabra]
MSSRWPGHWICCRARFSGGFLSFALPLSTTLSGHWPPGGIGISPHRTRRRPDCRFICLSYRTLEIEAVLDQGFLQEEHRALWCSIVPLIYFGTIEWHQVDCGIPQFGGVQNRRTRFSAGMHSGPLGMQVFEVVQSVDPGPTADFIQWSILVARRYLVPADCFHHLPPDEIPVEATQRQLGPHPAAMTCLMCRITGDL